MKYIKLGLAYVVSMARTVIFWASFKLEDVAWFLDDVVAKLNPDKALSASYTTTLSGTGPDYELEKCEPNGCGNCDCKK